MLRKLLRPLIAVLIALAVPLQALSAVTAGQCVALGHDHGAIGQSSHAHMHAAPEGHDHAGHEHAVEAADADDAGNGHCGPCAACCASASITGPHGPSIASAQSDAAYLWPHLPAFGVMPQGLDRPPLAL